MSQKLMIEKFARDVLGCTCPDSVFKKIECGWRVIDSINKVFEIQIGGRLLIFLWDEEISNVKKTIHSVLQCGRDFRDNKSFNRFRLVITSNLNEEIRRDIEEQFQKNSQVDDKIHLHFIPRNQIPKKIYKTQTEDGEG